jgi:uncharacterized protein YraI
MKRLMLITVILFAVIAVIQPAAAQSTTWTAEYFGNPSLIGPPTVVLTEFSPSHNWGYNAPVTGVPADNFSVRWSTNTYVNAGVYQFIVRSDDGVRVSVDGFVYIDRFAPATGQTYTAQVNLAAGNHTFVVEYYDALQVAFLDYNFTPVGFVTPTVPPVSGASATVTTNVLNVRNAPNLFAPILTRVNFGQTFPVIGRNADTSWLQINANGVVGWVYIIYVQAYNIGGVPITDGGTFPTPTPIPPPPPSGATATVNTSLLNVRNAPNPFTGVVLTRISFGQVYPVIGRNADSSWLQLNVNGLVGWVNARYVQAFNIGGVPVTDPGTNPVPPPTSSYGTVTAYYLNVRSAPNPFAARLTVISRGQTYPVIGRTFDSTWVQINVNGVPGWVNRAYMNVTNIFSVPVTA